jgi:predicted HicB family RNase H-like nuclease
MSSIIFWGAIIVGGSFIYIGMGGQPSKKEQKEQKEEHHYNKETYEYFCKLPLDEQERYFNENLDLRYYKDDSTVGLTNDKYLNAKHAEEISRRTGKPFTDRYKVY